MQVLPPGQLGEPRCSVSLLPRWQVLPFAQTPSWMKERKAPYHPSFQAAAHPPPLNKPLALDELANLHDSCAEARESAGEKMSYEKGRGGEVSGSGGVLWSFFSSFLSVPFFSSPPPLVSFSSPENFEIICVSWVFYIF